MSFRVWPERASICHRKDEPGPVLRDPALHPNNNPHTAPQSPENHFQGPSSWIVPTNTSHPPTNKPLSRKQMAAPTQGAAKSFQLPRRARCCSSAPSKWWGILRFQVQQDQPWQWKSWFKTSSSSHPEAYSQKTFCYDQINHRSACSKSPNFVVICTQAEVTGDSYQDP